MSQTHVHKITIVPAFNMAIGLNDLIGPNGTGFTRCHFRAQKSRDFQGPPLPLALEIDFPTSILLHLAPYKQEEH
jgi:hypothetical protein